MQSVVESGVLAGFPMLDIKVTLIDGAYHDVDSSVMAFEIAGRAAFREGALKAGPKLLEPIMKVEVVTPEDYVGGIIGDLTSRRGQVRGQETRGNAVGDQRHGAARQYVRLREQPPLDEPGPRAVHHAVRSLCAGAAGQLRKRCRRSSPKRLAGAGAGRTKFD